MSSQTAETIRQVTKELRDDVLQTFRPRTDDLVYHPVPAASVETERVSWRLRLELAYNTSLALGLDLYDEIILGRGADEGALVSLDAFEAADLGVSRRHVTLRPTGNKLYIVDLDSTNGTTVNGRSIGVNTPYSLSDGDLIVLGRLELVARIVQRPHNEAVNGLDVDYPSDVPLALAALLLTQLHVEEVLAQTLAITQELTGVDEATIWLVDEQTGELFLEAARGLENEALRDVRLCIDETLAGQVIASGLPVRANSEAGAAPIKVKTGYLVEAVIYVPLTLGGVTFGVLSAARHAPGAHIDIRDEQIMIALANLTALAVQNARRFEDVTLALARKNKLLTAVQVALSQQVKDALNSVMGYAGLLGLDGSLDDYGRDNVDCITEAGQHIAGIIDRLVEAVRLSEAPLLHQATCDLVEEVTRIVHEIGERAIEDRTRVEFRLVGEPFLITADPGYLSRAVRNLVENAVEHTPPGSNVLTTLAFTRGEVLIRVRDDGPGISEDELPHLFDRYYRHGVGNGASGAGLGLGLELARTLIEAHRGTVTARRSQDGGMEFIISLPGTLRVV